MNLYIYRNHPTLVLYAILIASLPLFFVRYEFIPGSISFVVLASIGLLVVAEIILRGKVKKIFGPIEGLILIYLILVSLIFLVHMNESALVPMYKTWVYFVLYLLLKNFLVSINFTHVENATFHGVVGGTLIFFVISALLLFQSGQFLSALGNLSHASLTFKIYAHLNEFLGGMENFTTRNLMRSVVGESFAFYGLFLISKIAKYRSLPLLLLYLLEILFVIVSFSRRSLIAVGVSSFFIFFVTSKSIFTKAVIAPIIFMSLGVIVFLITSDSRIFDFSNLGGTRGDMYVLAIDGFLDRPVLGNGYGVKIIDDNYVHNFILSSAFSLGISGLIVSFLIIGYLIVKYLHAIVQRTGSIYTFFLIIPIIGSMVGSTLEGMFTVTSWIILALWTVSRTGFQITTPISTICVKNELVAEK